MNLIVRGFALFLLLICIFNLSCNAQTNLKFEAQPLVEYKLGIQSNIDSSIYYFNQLIDLQSKGEISDEIVNPYRRKINYFFININNALKDAPIVAKEQHLSKAEFDQWMKGIITDSLSAKMKILRSVGIDINSFPITHKYNLTQNFVDTTNNFSIKFPMNWEIKPDTTRNVVQGSGQILTEDGTLRAAKAVFSVNITPLIKGYTNEVKVRDHIIYLKKEMASFVLLEQYNININNSPGIYIRYSGSFNGLPLKVTQIHFDNGDKKYVFIGSVSEDETNYVDFQELFVEIARSFNFIKLK